MLRPEIIVFVLRDLMMLWNKLIRHFFELVFSDLLHQIGLFCLVQYSSTFEQDHTCYKGEV